MTSVFARDADGDAPNNELFYVIDSGDSDKFRMNGSTGDISVQRGATIDRELDSTFTLVVLAIDRGSPPLSGTATVTIHVDDVNDQAPSFQPDHVTLEAREDAPPGGVLYNFSAADGDGDASLSYSVLWNVSSGHDADQNDMTITRIQVGQQA